MSLVTVQEPRPTVEARIEIRRLPHPIWKRMLDLTIATVVTLLVAPLLLAVAVYIRVVSRGPALFVQSRVGYGGESFRIFKFRTMHVPEKSRDLQHREYVHALASVGQPLSKPDYFRNELIPGGGLLRKLSLDELPQLINVFGGSMSLVGPRPDVLKLDDYEPWHLRRFEVLPGVTGLWQVSGKNRLTHDEMVHLDIEYVERRTLGSDLMILLRTVYVLVFDRDE